MKPMFTTEQLTEMAELAEQHRDKELKHTREVIYKLDREKYKGYLDADHFYELLSGMEQRFDRGVEVNKDLLLAMRREAQRRKSCR